MTQQLKGYYNIQLLTPDDGLSQGSNYFYHEDSKGFMWITGNDAINRFDGYNIKVFNLSKYFFNCPALQQGYGIVEDNNANLYVGSVRGLYKYNRNKDQFSLIKIFDSTVGDVAMPFAFHKGKIWCYNLKYQIATYDVLSKKVEEKSSIPLPPISSIHIYDNVGNCFYNRWPFIDSGGTAWFVGRKQIVSCDISTGKTLEFPHRLLPPNIEFFCSRYDPLDNKLVFICNKGLWAIDLQANTSEAIYKASAFDNLAIGSRYVVRSKDGALFFITKDGKIETATAIPTNQYARVGFMRFDKSGRLWMCNDGQGQVIVDFGGYLLPKLPNEHYHLPMIESMGVGSFCELSNGEIWVGGKAIFNPLTGGAYQKPITINGVYTGGRMVHDKLRNGYWIMSENAANNSNISFLNEKPQLPNFQVNYTGVSDLKQVQDLKVLPDGRILLCATAGLYWLDATNHAISKIETQPYPNAFVANTLTRHRLAISYLNNDMWLTESQPGQPLKFIKRILPGVQSFYVAEDSARKQYWVGSNNGIYLLTENFETIKKFDANNGLAGTYIYGLLLDNEGNAWCSHQRGLSRIVAGDHNIINFTKEDGIQDWDYNNRAFLRGSDGTLYFGGVKGFNYIKPPFQPRQYYTPKVYIDEIRINNADYHTGTNTDLIKTLNLKNTENNIAIKALINNLGEGGANQLIYRIVETDAAWKRIGQGNPILFNSLAPGKYTLQLSIYNRFDNRYLQQRTLTIFIAAPFYRTAWFMVLASGLASVAVFSLFARRRFLKQRRNYQQQLALEQQRQKLTADLHDDIGASLSSLQINSAIAKKLYQTNAPETEKLLNAVEEQSRSISEKIGDFIWSIKPGKEELMTMSTRIKNFVSEILGNNSSLSYTVSIDEQTDSVINDFMKRKNIVLIIKEAVNNVAKYSKATLVSISIQIDKNKATAIIKDNGTGFTGNITTGNGLKNMQKRSEEMGGTFEISTAPKQGCTIKVQIPLP